MHNKITKDLMVTLILLAMGSLGAQAFSLSKFTYNSKLSNGKWVKIAIAEDGIYQITTEQLAEMGFSDMNRVQIYGQGGHAIAENMNGNHTDDLTAVPIMVTNDKVIFYAQGVVGKQMYDNTLAHPYYMRSRNAYANCGYYFITETNNRTEIQTQSTTAQGTNRLTDSYGMFLHESELVSPGLTGRHLLGESILSDTVSIPYMLPNRSDNTITIHVEGAARVTNQNVYLNTSITSGGTTLVQEYYTSENRIRSINSKDLRRHYNECAITKSETLIDTNEQGLLNVYLYNPWSASVTMGNLDYAIITYKHTNSYEGEKSFFAMGFPMLTASDQVVMPGTDSATVVWNVTNPQQAIQMLLEPALDADGQVIGMGFTPGSSNASPAEFIAFNPGQTLNEISGYQAIETQNLHGLSTPDMLIVTNAYFKPEADRLAQMHRDHDGMVVHVVDQEQVFNEFSSGTPDAMGIRLFCKMLYDRGSYKFRHLLMFGPASYDFRGITTDKANRVITYETDKGDSDETSYSSDDFFGILDDNTGTQLTTQSLRLGIGRLTPSDLTQAHQNVDKIMHYVVNPDYGVWRNHYTVWADAGDHDLHALQAESIENMLQDELDTHMVSGKAYVDMFPLESGIASEARRHVIDLLNQGQYYATYVGHANTKSFTSSRMWTQVNVRDQHYSHLPIFMTACCDVARFDGNDQGIAEIMFHQPNGGAIALLTSSREVEAFDNNYINRAFTSAMFNYKSTATMTTLGEAYMKTKQSPLTQGLTAKMSYLLIGDPAIKVQYPKPLFKIKTINGISIDNTTVKLSPLQQVTVEAEVYRSATSQTINTSFNGSATLSIYGSKRLLRNTFYVNTSNDTLLSGDVFYPRELLTEVQGRVVNGHFTGIAVMPRYYNAQPDDQLAIHVYAHQDNSADMVNGSTTQVVAAAYDDSVAVQDDVVPVIELMYLNEQEAFEKGIAVTANSTLHVIASDDVAFNNQSMGVGSSVNLVLDGGSTNYTQVHNFLTIDNSGKSLELHFPITNLAPGQHSLTMTVQDIAGNSAQRTISFMVAEASSVSLKTDELLAIDKATIDLDESNLPSDSRMTLKVVDAQGHLVWRTNSSLPCSWDLTDTAGNRVAPGLYKVFGQYDDGVNHCGTNIMPILVMNPVIQAEQSQTKQ